MMHVQFCVVMILSCTKQRQRTTIYLKAYICFALSLSAFGMLLVLLFALHFLKTVAQAHFRDGFTVDEFFVVVESFFCRHPGCLLSGPLLQSLL